MYYNGKQITNLVSVCKVGKDVYYNLDFIGNFKASIIKIRDFNNQQKNLNTNKIEYLYIYTIKGNAKKEVTDDPIKLVDEVNSKYNNFGINAILTNPVHIKRSYIKYNWLDENGFIGPDDTLVLRNKKEFSFYKNCLNFIEEIQEYTKVEKYKDRVTTYKFHKYGIEGKIKKHRDGQGEIKFKIPGGDNKISFEYYANGIAHNIKTTNYRTKEITNEDKYKINELNKIIVSLGLKEIINGK